MVPSQLICDLSKGEITDNIEDIAEQNSEDENEGMAHPYLSCKSFMKSQLYSDLSYAYGGDSEEDELWQREIMDADTYQRIFKKN